MRQGPCGLYATLAISAWACASACARHHDASLAPATLPPGSDAPPPAPVASVIADASSSVDAAHLDANTYVDAAARRAKAKAATSWVDDVRRQRWADAAEKLDALSGTEQKRADIRYVRARVALALGDASTASARLDGLDAELPLLASDIERHLADARLAVGPYDKAAAYFGAHPTPSSLLLSAAAYEKANDLVRARSTCQRVVGFAKKSRLEEAEARACELRLSKGPESATLAAGDARWISVHAPESPWGKEADQALQRLAPSHPLLGEELLVRAQNLADAGRTDDALKALDRVAGAPPPKVPHLTELRLRGDILYRTRGRALEASHALEESAALGGSHATEDSFHSARALARADHDEEAAYRFGVIARNHPGTHWGDEAQFFVPYLALLHGKWREAAAGFDEYARTYPKGVERRDGQHGGALAHLMNEDYGTARRLFEEVAAEESDPLASARARELAALAALRDGDRLHAVAGWSAIIRSYPLSWAALVARARLGEMNAPAPPWLEPGRGGLAGPPFVVKLPPPVDLLHRLGLDADAEAALHEREGVLFGGAPAGRGLEALCGAYALIGRAKRRFHLISQIPVDTLRTQPTPSTQWAWECAYPTPFTDDMREDALPSAPHAEGGSVGAGLPTDDILAYAVMRQESNFDPDALSPAHAVGLMQLLPETARVVAGELHVPYDDARLTQPSFNMALGTRYLADLGEKFEERPSKLPLVVAAYNAGDEAVTRWLSRVPKMDIDEFVERIPYVETRGYVARVMGNWAHYEYLKHGENGVPSLRLPLQN
jgi:soluble lytic murein transglycosylase